MASCVRIRTDGILIAVKVQPGARRNEIVGVDNEQLRVRTTAPPADGKATKAAIKLLAAYLEIAPSWLSLVRGESQRNKQFLIRV